MLLLALMFYLHYEAPEDEQNFLMVMEMIRAGEVREDDEAFQSPLDILFRKLEMKNPEHIALKYYKAYHSGSGKTLKSLSLHDALPIYPEIHPDHLDFKIGKVQSDLSRRYHADG